MMNFSNREDMGTFLQKCSDSILFPLVAELYSMDGDYSEAEEICKTGLNHHPEHPDGLFVLAQINKENKNYKTAEKTLKNLLKSHTVYPEALRLLAEVQEKLNRSPNTLKALRKKYERFDYTSTQKRRKEIPMRIKTNIQKTSSPVSSVELKPLNISSKLATFTLAEILENQGLYPQAIDILDMIEENEKDKKRLKEYRNRISKKFHSQN